MGRADASKALIDVRRLAAVDLYGRRGANLRRRLVLAEFVLAAINGPLLGVAIVLAAPSAPWVLFGACLIGIGLNYVPLALHATCLSRAGKLDAELAGVDAGAELRRYAAKQFLLVIPLLVLILGAVEAAASRRAPSESPATADAVGSIGVERFTPPGGEDQATLSVQTDPATSLRYSALMGL